LRRVALALAVAAAGACAKPRQPGDPKEPLPAGSPAPHFEAVAHDGQTIRLAELRGHPVVLYFYPKDDTPG
jgi:cytochrome oxidase Cu insertion factor (SCO1/SenC/PrrC family)